MKNLKKVMSVALAGILAFGMCGCGKKKEETKKKASSGEKKEERAEKNSGASFDMSNVNVGDTVTIGKYEWIVLAKNDTSAYVITKDIIEFLSYDPNVNDPEEKEHYLQIIQNRISSLKELLEELFTYTKMQDQSYELAVVPMDGGQCICETVLAFYEDFEKRGLEPDVNFCEEELPIVANEVALRRVIQNIVKNALVHGMSRIGLTLEKTDGKLHFSCYNDKKPGEVIDVQQIFDRFYKGDKARTSTSTGLGLAIAKGLVERMKGTISAEVKDEMFVLDIYLPLSEKTGNEKERIVEKDH